MFLARLSEAGIKESPFYNDNSLSAFNGTANAMPNCTAYAFARTAELSYPTNVRDNVLFARKGADNAKAWYSTTLWKKGSVPKPGSIACWDGELGHVAVVEEVLDDGSVLVSQSNFGGSFFETKEYSCKVGEVTEGVGLVFQGYIYNPYVKDLRTDSIHDGQVDVIADRLRARKSPNGELYEGLYCPVGTYEVIGIEHEGEYSWAKIDDGVWIAMNDGWTVLREASETGDFETYVNELDGIISEIRTLKSRLENERKRYLEVSQKIAELI